MLNLNLPSGVKLLETDNIPADNPDHGGEQAVKLQTASGEVAWGFGESIDDAAADALAALAEDI